MDGPSEPSSGQGGILIEMNLDDQDSGVLRCTSVDEPTPRFGTVPLADLSLDRIQSFEAGEAHQTMFIAPAKQGKRSLFDASPLPPGSAGTGRLLPAPFLIQATGASLRHLVAECLIRRTHLHSLDTSHEWAVQDSNL